MCNADAPFHCELPCRPYPPNPDPPLFLYSTPFDQKHHYFKNIITHRKHYSIPSPNELSQQVFQTF